MSHASHSTFLIIGGGVFGVSTAYHLIKAHPEASITLVDRSAPPCSLAASFDFNKVVRADYGNLFYCELALKAVEFWRTDPLYKEFYHQSGLLNIDNTGLGRKIIENYQTLKVPCESVIIGPDDLKQRYGGVFEDTDYRGVEEIFLNPLSGWAEATAALKNVIEAAITLGVKWVEGDIETLTFDEKGACTGVRTSDGRILAATHTILSTGAGTAKLLADSAPDRPELQVEDRITAAAVATGVVKLSPEEAVRFKDVPAWLHAVGDTKCETFPPMADGTVKFIRDASFKNTFKHAKSGAFISAPPDLPNQAQEVLSSGLQEELLEVVRDFIISKHPHCQNLVIATAGSFHGWKFLPIIGDYVVKLLDGNLEHALVKRWAWDREQTGSAHARLIPQRELKDI